MSEQFSLVNIPQHFWKSNQDSRARPQVTSSLITPWNMEECGGQGALRPVVLKLWVTTPFKGSRALSKGVTHQIFCISDIYINISSNITVMKEQQK